MLVVKEIEKHSTLIQDPLLSAIALARTRNVPALQDIQEKTKKFNIPSRRKSSFSLLYCSKLVSEIGKFNSKVIDDAYENLLENSKDGESAKSQAFLKATLTFSSGKVCVRKADSTLEDDILLKTGVERVVLLAQVLANTSSLTLILF